ncbi:MAG: hypothetical protein K9N47_05520 [Prosthecobacter sp.]|uniref:hypothetical protein n=1 Tax=Prosthecobacter sp. TaxID=1965333 RepID=UPI0025E50C8C|nr:hypothetical protein [Prosthecobacter sp.]MCF7785559.1 hypothetical protein [Prosthecobacter sp.]
MARNPKSTIATTLAAPAELPPNTAALEKIRAQFTPDRWGKITRQAQNSCALDANGLQALCTQMLATRAARHPGNEAAALYAACNGLLIAIGSKLNEHDCQRFEKAIATGETSPLPEPPAAAAETSVEDAAVPAPEAAAVPAA